MDKFDQFKELYEEYQDLAISAINFRSQLISELSKEDRKIFERKINNRWGCVSSTVFKVSIDGLLMQDNDNRLFFIPKEALDPISGAEYIKKTIFEEIQEAKEKRHIEHVNQINSLRSKISELTEQLQNIEKKVILNTITISKGDEVSAIPGFNEFYEELKDKFAPITDDHSKLIDRYKKTSRSSKR